MTLTAKQEAFAQAVAAGSNQTEAYRQNYDTSGSLPATTWDNAYTLATCPEVAPRIAELKAITEAAMARELDITAASVAWEAKENLRLARDYHQIGSANGALELMARVSGVLSDTGKDVPQVTKVTYIYNEAPRVVPPLEPRILDASEPGDEDPE